MKTLWRFLTWVLGAGLSGAALVLILLYIFSFDLPDYRQLEHYEPPVVSRLYASDGSLFTEYATEKRVFVPIESIPKVVINAFIAAEDKNFFEHTGVDIMGLFRAIIRNVTSSFTGRSMMGGSTITQQVAKNFLLTNEKTISRKVKEAILSFRIEKSFSKTKILELYLNEIYFGAGAYGIAAAAAQYFDKSLDQLTIDEMAFLAGLPKAPSYYHPAKHPKEALTRRNWVIGRMLEEKFITAEEAVAAKHRPLAMAAPGYISSIRAGYFAEVVRQKIVELYGEDALYKRGLTIRTTVDKRLQTLAQKSLREGLLRIDRQIGWRGPVTKLTLASDWKAQLKAIANPGGIGTWQLAVVLGVGNNAARIGLKSGKVASIPLEGLKWARAHKRNKEDFPYLGPEIRTPSDVVRVGDVVCVSEQPDNLYHLEQIPEVEGALVAMDVHTGRVLALTGGYSFDKSQFNRATQADRQTGSGFKTFVYLAALEHGMTPITPILDAPIVFDQGPGLGLWKPKNVEKKFHGVIPLRESLEKSHNLSTVRVAQKIGMNHVNEMARRLGIADNWPPQLAISLGAGQSTLLKVATAYAIIFNGGKEVKPFLIDRVQDRKGQTIYRSDNRPCPYPSLQKWQAHLPDALADTRAQLLNPIHAYQILAMLEGVMKRGSGRTLQVPGAILAGKTGTTNLGKDTWFIGGTADMIVAVYVGYDQPRTMGQHAVGSRIAGPIFKAFIQQAVAGQPAKPFRAPPGARFVWTDLKTGARTVANAPNAELTAFTPGTEPEFQDGPITPIEGDPVPKEILDFSSGEVY